MATEKWSEEPIITQSDNTTMVCVIDKYGSNPDNRLISQENLIKGSGVMSSYLPLTGGTINGNFTITGSTTVGSIAINGSNNNFLLLGGGGLKATSDFAASVHYHNGVYLPLTGGTISGNVSSTSFIKSGSSDSYVLLGGGGSSQLSTFVKDGSYIGQLSIHGSITAQSFIRSGSTNEYVLLASGGTKPLTDFISSGSYDSVFVNVTGDTMTGLLTLNSGLNVISDAKIAKYGLTPTNGSGLSSIEIIGSATSSANDISEIKLTQYYNSNKYPARIYNMFNATQGAAGCDLGIDMSYWNGSSVETSNRITVNGRFGGVGINTSNQTLLQSYKLAVSGSTYTQGLTLANTTGGLIPITVDSSGNLKFEGNIYATGEISAYGYGSTPLVYMPLTGGTLNGDLSVTGMTSTKTIKITQLKTVTPTSAGSAGEICFDTNYVYVCVGTNTWKRSALLSASW